MNNERVCSFNETMFKSFASTLIRNPLKQRGRQTEATGRKRNFNCNFEHQCIESEARMLPTRSSPSKFISVAIDSFLSSTGGRAIRERSEF